MQKRISRLKAIDTNFRSEMLGDNEPNGRGVAGKRFLRDTERGHGNSTAGRDMAQAATVFRGVLLVILLSPIEGSGKFDLCNDRALVHSRFREPSNRLARGGFLFQGW